MSRILAYTAPARGQLFPVVPILAELQRRGHEVVLRTLAGEVGTMRAQGIDAAPLAAEVEAIAMDDWRARTTPGALARAARRFAARAPREAPDLAGAIAAEQPDALLVDAAAWGALGAAEAWGGRWASTCPFPLPLPSRGAPPAGPGLPPAAGPLGRARDRLLGPVVEHGFDRLVLAELNPLRAKLGLPALEHAAQIFLAPPLLLSLTAEPFEYPHPDWPASIVMVGPCNWEPPGRLPRELERVEAPLVLVNSSSEFQDDAALVEVALRALATEPVHVVATVPASGSAGLSRPANATVLDYAPHAPILARAVCAVTHGGMGSTQKALAHGVPVCAVPFGRDQLEVARRVEVAGAGTKLLPYRLTPRRLRAGVRRAIRRRAGAERVGRAFAAAGGAVAAADAFEQRLLG